MIIPESLQEFTAIVRDFMTSFLPATRCLNIRSCTEPSALIGENGRRIHDHGLCWAAGPAVTMYSPYFRGHVEESDTTIE
jgi:hypothetical protein